MGDGLDTRKKRTPVYPTQEPTQLRIAKLGADDWEEIYYALDLKIRQIEEGKYDDEPGEVDRAGSETARWAATLRGIMMKIERS
jgi:hypothetical protein